MAIIICNYMYILQRKSILYFRSYFNYYISIDFYCILIAIKNTILSDKPNVLFKIWPKCINICVFQAFYYIAIVEDFVLRFGWALSMSLTEMGYVHGDLMVSILSPLEVMRLVFDWVKMHITINYIILLSRYSV